MILLPIIESRAKIVDGKVLQVWPKFRLSTEFVPEWGELKCKKLGEYKLIFDNTHSMLKSKQVKYKTEVVEAF